MLVLVFAELDNGHLKKISQEAIFYGSEVAKSLGGEAIALVIGKAEKAELEVAGRFGAKKVLHVSDDKLNAENGVAYADVLAQAVQKTGAKVIVLAKSGLGDAVTSRVAAKLKGGVISGAVDLPSLDGGFKVKKAIFSGKAFEEVEVKTEVKIISIRRNTIETAETDTKAEVEAFSPTLNPGDFEARVLETEKVETELSLADADIIVSGGRGMKEPDNWSILLDLAKALHAATGCSKPVSDMDWRPHHEHIGQTGLKVAPNLYIACGISGAIQHLAGMNGSKCIVVINKDAEAPFFKVAHYGIVGDVNDILPRLTKAAKEG